MRILFTTSAAPEKSPFFTDEKRPPLGVGSLISICRKEGHKVFFIDNYLKKTSFIEEGFLQENNVDIIGIYVNTICFNDSINMMEKIEVLRQKGLWKGKIAVGGPHTSVLPETIPKYVDFVVQGEGETAVIDILEGRTSKRLIRKERIKDLDLLPFQPWDIFTALDYDFSCKWLDEEPVFTLNTSRGCSFNCGFCSVDSIWGRQYSYYSPDRIIEEIKYLAARYGARGIYFREDNFTLNHNRTVSFCEKLINEKLDISWACETRVDNLTEEHIGLMSRAGCKAFYLGVESGSERILSMLGKKITVDDIKRVIDASNKHGIRTYCSLLAGVPGENFEDYIKTKSLMEELKPFTYGFNIFVGIPFSNLYYYYLENEVYEHIDDFGLIYPPGFDVKSWFFYGKDSEDMVDFDFKEITEYDIHILELFEKEQKTEFICKNLKKLLDHNNLDAFSKRFEAFGIFIDEDSDLKYKLITMIYRYLEKTENESARFPIEDLINWLKEYIENGKNLSKCSKMETYSILSAYYRSRDKDKFIIYRYREAIERFLLADSIEDVDDFMNFTENFLKEKDVYKHLLEKKLKYASMPDDINYLQKQIQNLIIDYNKDSLYSRKTAPGIISRI